MLTTLILFAAKYLFVVPPVLVAYVWWRSDASARRTLLARGLIVLALSIVLAKAGGAIYHEQRPFVVEHAAPLIPHPADNGFPSDHTLLCFAIAFLVLPFSRRACGLALVVGSLVATARIASLLHSPLDVGASIVFAAAASGAAWALVRSRAGLVRRPAAA